MHDQSGLSFCNPIDCIPPVSSVHGILQARILELGCHFLLQGLFLIQGSNPRLLHLPHWQVDSSPMSHLGSQCEWLGTRIRIYCFDNELFLLFEYSVSQGKNEFVYNSSWMRYISHICKYLLALLKLRAKIHIVNWMKWIKSTNTTWWCLHVYSPM